MPELTGPAQPSRLWFFAPRGCPGGFGGVPCGCRDALRECRSALHASATSRPVPVAGPGRVCPQTPIARRAPACGHPGDYRAGLRAHPFAPLECCAGRAARGVPPHFGDSPLPVAPARPRAQRPAPSAATPPGTPRSPAESFGFISSSVAYRQHPPCRSSCSRALFVYGTLQTE